MIFYLLTWYLVGYASWIISMAYEFDQITVRDAVSALMFGMLGPIVPLLVLGFVGGNIIIWKRKDIEDDDNNQPT